MPDPAERAPRPPRKAIFGGTFDPVHLGHLGMVQAVQQGLNLDQTLLVPCQISPFKSSVLASTTQRCDMLELGISELGLTRATVSTWEINREGPSYSWQTAHHFRETQPAVEWFWLLGGDQWEQVHRWANAESLREHLRFAVVTRRGHQVVPRSGWRHEVIEYDHPASSTRLREDFQAHRHWLPESVAQYCEQHGLYQTR